MIGNGYLQLTTTNPGSMTWLAQLNANLQAIDESQPWIRRLPAGETIAVNDAVAVDSATGKLFKADSNGTNNRWNMVGLAISAGPLDTQIYFRVTGEMGFTHGNTPGSLIYLSETAGQITPTAPAGARKVGMWFPSNKIYLNCGMDWRST